MKEQETLIESRESIINDINKAYESSCSPISEEHDRIAKNAYLKCEIIDIYTKPEEINKSNIVDIMQFDYNYWRVHSDCRNVLNKKFNIKSYEGYKKALQYISIHSKWNLEELIRSAIRNSVLNNTPLRIEVNKIKEKLRKM